MGKTMNEYQSTLFNNLTHLVETNEAFFSNDWPVDNIIYRNFAYRLASYTDFLEPSAKECRGVMFSIDTETGEIALVSLPFEKFFNHNENPFTMDLDLSDIVEIADKADGSLITTYTHDGVLQFKTKGSLTSDQAINANMFMHLEDNAAFRSELIKGEQLGCTIIMEWCAPDNRIVLPYMEGRLIVLGIRNREDGSYINFEDVDGEHFPETLNRWTKIIQTDDAKAYIENVDDMTKVEGVVFRMKDGQRVKKKCTWYLALHHTKDSINTPRRLYEAVLEEATDDMRSLFHDDPLALKMISEMEEFVEVRYNRFVETIETFYDAHKDEDRKTFAIAGQGALTKTQFGLAMARYIGRDYSYKDAMKKRWKEFNLKDEKVIVE